MLTIPQIRSIIGDTGVLFPPANQTPNNLASTDGATTTFFTPDSAFVTSSLTVYLWSNVSAGSTPTLTQVNPSLYTVTPPAIKFTAAPATGQTLAVRYLKAGFSDQELSDILARISTVYAGSDDTVLVAGVQREVIAAELLSPTRMANIHYEQYTADRSALVSSLRQLYKDLEKMIAGGPTPGSSSPAGGSGNVYSGAGGGQQFPYQPETA